MNHVINVGEVTLVAKYPEDFGILIELLKGNYVQWADDYYHPIERLSSIEIKNIISDYRDKFHRWNIESIKAFQFLEDLKNNTNTYSIDLCKCENCICEINLT